jgi:hypothetical protein
MRSMRFSEGGTRTFYRLDLATGKFEHIEPFKAIPRGTPHGAYGIASDAQNNLWFMDFAVLSFVESAPRAYRLKASNAAPSSSTSTGTFPAFENIDCMIAILSCQTKNRFYESTQCLIQSRRVLCGVTNLGNAGYSRFARGDGKCSKR